MAKHSHYDTLGVSPKATGDEIRQAFRQIAKLRHPDTAAGSESAMRRLNEAYETLKDPDRRRDYDRHLQLPAAKMASRPPAPPPPLAPDVFWSQVLVPLDRTVASALRDLRVALAEIEEDPEDEAAITAFDLGLEAVDGALTKAVNTLAAVSWPPSLQAGLERYRDGVRAAATAVATLLDYSLDLDASLLDEGRSWLQRADRALAEGRRR